MTTEALLPCPLCGVAGKGYELWAQTHSFRWWNIVCSVCNGVVAECGQQTTDDVWNRAAAYAEKMRIGYVRYETLRKLSISEFRALAENLALRSIGGECRVDNLADLVDKLE